MTRHCKAQAATEFLVVCAAVATAIGLGLGPHGGLLASLLDSFRTAFAHFSFALSIPT